MLYFVFYCCYLLYALVDQITSVGEEKAIFSAIDYL